MQQTAEIRGRAQTELDQLRLTIEILQSGKGVGASAYLIEVFKDLVDHFAGAMELFPVDHVSVIAGSNPQTGPISAIHPNALDTELTRRIGEVLGVDGNGAKTAGSATG